MDSKPNKRNLPTKRHLEDYQQVNIFPEGNHSSNNDNEGIEPQRKIRRLNNRNNSCNLPKPINNYNITSSRSSAQSRLLIHKSDASQSKHVSNVSTITSPEHNVLKYDTTQSKHVSNVSTYTSAEHNAHNFKTPNTRYNINPETYTSKILQSSKNKAQERLQNLSQYLKERNSSMENLTKNRVSESAPSNSDPINQTKYIHSNQRAPFTASSKTISSTISCSGAEDPPNTKDIGNYCPLKTDLTHLENKNLCSIDEDVSIKELPDNRSTSDSTSEDILLNNNEKPIYIVVDTNIFINNIQTVTNILHITYEDDTHPIIYVPWMVIQELDYFKDGYSLSKKYPISNVIQDCARKAVKFINDCLRYKNAKFKGQTVRDATEHTIKSSSPDDSIMSCCLQAAKLNKVILLSSDTNLRNKALINEIDSYAPEEIIKHLKKKKIKSNNMIKEISEKMSFLCSFIIHSEIKKYYSGEYYSSLHMSLLPWTLQQCLQYIKEYYNPVFISSLQKQCLKIVNEFLDVVAANDTRNDELFVELSLSLLIYMKNGLQKYELNIQKAIDEIKILEKK